METVGRSQRAPVTVLLAVTAFAGLGALALYWSQAPESNYPTLANVILSYLLLWVPIFLWSNAPRAERASRFLLTTATIAITVGLLELSVAARVVDFRVTFNTLPKEPWYHPDNILDPKLLHIHQPYYRQSWDGIEYRYDSHGLRNESDLEAADIVVIGDSFVEGWGVPASGMLTSQLARQLNRTVANLGQSWYGPQQELELLRRFGLPLRPDTCVWMFYEGNDLFDVQRYKWATKEWEVFSRNLHSFVQRSFSKNAMLAVRRLLDQIWIGSTEEIRWYEDRAGTFRSADGGDLRIYFPAPALPLSKSDEEALEEVRVNLIRANDLCHAIGARFLVVFAPNKFRVYKDFTELDAHAVPRDWMINDLPERIESLVGADIPDARFLDLTPVLKTQAGIGSLVYFPGRDTHWSPEGHRVAATAIGDVMTKWKAAGDSAGRPRIAHSQPPFN